MYVCIYIYISISLSLYIYIYIYTYVYIPGPIPPSGSLGKGIPLREARLAQALRPVHLLRVFLLRVLESNFPGDPLSNSTDMRIPTPEN